MVEFISGGWKYMINPAPPPCSSFSELPCPGAPAQAVQTPPNPAVPPGGKYFTLRDTAPATSNRCPKSHAPQTSVVSPLGKTKLLHTQPGASVQHCKESRRSCTCDAVPEPLPRVTNHRNHKPAHLRRHASSITQLCLS